MKAAGRRADLSVLSPQAAFDRHARADRSRGRTYACLSHLQSEERNGMSAIIRGAARWSAAGIGLAVGAYAGYVGAAWLRYGQPPRQAGPEYHDELLDRFIPVYEAGAHHHVRISAPAEITFAAAREMDLFRSPVVRAIIRARELVLGATPDERRPPRALLEEMALGWGVLAKIPGRETERRARKGNRSSS